MTEKIKKSSIVDSPRKVGEEDLLGLDNHAKALTRFVENAATPLTIAIQGEWGSGKTSMMNQLQSVLCDRDDARFYGIWLNTWQYALLSDEELILSRIVSGLTYETIQAVQKVHPKKFGQRIDQVRDVTKCLLKGALKIGAGQVGGVTEGVVDEFINSGSAGLTVNDLRNELQELIHNSIVGDDKRDGFIFFIDDLDRIEPIYAVQILELLKNVFNLPNCVFILAIDYDVVVKGLEPKFGPLTEKNEREFRSFFDKIIQLPFTMPVGRYEIDDFIVNILSGVDYLTEAEERNSQFKKILSQMADYSVGRNPRALKRLTNSLSLIRIFNELDRQRDKKNDEPYEKLMNIGLICCQIAYPQIYRLLNAEPDFKMWNEEAATRFRLESIDTDELDRLVRLDEFDEEWEQVVYRVCQRDPYMAKNSNRVSLLLNLIADQLPEKIDLGETVESLLSLTSVTNVDSGQLERDSSVSKRSRYDILDGLLNEMDPASEMLDLRGLIKEIHDYVKGQYPNSTVSYGKRRMTFSDSKFPRATKTFLTVNAWNRVSVSLKIEKEGERESIPENAREASSEKDLPFFFLFKLKSPEEFTDEVRGYIERNHDMGMQGKSLK